LSDFRSVFNGVLDAARGALVLALVADLHHVDEAELLGDSARVLAAADLQIVQHVLDSLIIRESLRLLPVNFGVQRTGQASVELVNLVEAVQAESVAAG